VLDRCFALLGAFTPDGRLVSLATLVERTGLPKATVYRLAGQLVELGALEREQGKYRLGTRLFELGSMVTPHNHLRNVALPFMEDLFEATHETVNLGVRDGKELLYIDRISGHRVAPRAARVGSRRPLYCTALGKAILAFSPESVVNDVIAAGLRPQTRNTTISSTVLRDQLARARETHITYDREEFGTGVSCIATPVLRDRRAIAALSIAAPTNRLDADRYGIALKAIGASLSRLVGQLPHSSGTVEPDLVQDSTSHNCSHKCSL
jgi:DNA-binding IclR family transcriptional regulator